MDGRKNSRKSAGKKQKQGLLAGLCVTAILLLAAICIMLWFVVKDGKNGSGAAGASQQAGQAELRQTGEQNSQQTDKQTSGNAEQKDASGAADSETNTSEQTGASAAEAANSASTSDTTSTSNTSETSDISETAEDTAAMPTEGLNDLKGTLEAAISGYEGTWSIYVQDLQSDEYLSINSTPLKAASLIKLYIMGTVLQKISDGEMEQTDEINTLLWNMITVSDNESSNELVRQLSPTGEHADGMPVVNAFASEKGYGDTSQGRDLQDVRETPPPGENYTSVNDCGHFLSRVYHRDNISEEASQKMEELLLNQERTWKIPVGLPEGVRCANKTGELSDVEDDVAIVYASEQGGRDYILCVMTQDLPDVGTAQANISGLSGMVYEYFVS